MDVNDAWKSTCRTLLGAELGELGEFADYLRRYIDPIHQRPSSLSGKMVTLSDEELAPKARIIGFEEMDNYRNHTSQMALDINQIKDIDSIASALKEKFYYTGNVVLGNSAQIEDSHRCTNTFHVRESHEVADGQFIAFSTMTRYCDYVFGASIMGESSYLIKVLYSYKAMRCMECTHALRSSDCYFGANLEDCTDCMFSFNLRAKRNAIGNLTLEKSEYLPLKAKLCREIADELRAKKNMCGIIEMLSGLSKPAKPPAPLRPSGKKSEASQFRTQQPPSKEVEEAFEETTKVVLGRKLAGLQGYESWLLSNTRVPISCKSAISSKPLHTLPTLFDRQLMEAGKFVSREEALTLGENHIDKSQAEALSLQNADGLLNGILYSTPEVMLGQSEDVQESVVWNTARHCYGGSVYYFSKCCAYCFWPRNSEYAFGSTLLFSSKFCLDCHHSSDLTRCFECSDCNSGSDLYFCHNVENCTECMFCFNVKAKRYAIGNVEYPKEEYMKAKKLLLSEIASKLEKNKKLEYSIYTLGSPRP